MEDQAGLPPWMTEFIALAPRARAMLLRALGSALLWTLIALPFLWVGGSWGATAIAIGALAGVTAVERHWPLASTLPSSGQGGRGVGGALVAIVGQTVPLRLLVTDVLAAALTLSLWAVGALLGVESALLLAAGSGTACFASATLTLLLRQLLTPPAYRDGDEWAGEDGEASSGQTVSQGAGRQEHGRGGRRRWLVLLGVAAGWAVAILISSALLDAVGPWWLVAAGVVAADLAALLALRLGRRRRNSSVTVGSATGEAWLS